MDNRGAGYVCIELVWGALGGGHQQVGAHYFSHRFNMELVLRGFHSICFGFGCRCGQYASDGAPDS